MELCGEKKRRDKRSERTMSKNYKIKNKLNTWREREDYHAEDISHTTERKEKTRQLN